jgi:hypothetical protein
MRIPIFPIIAVLLLPRVSAAQFDTSPPIQLFGEGAYFSNVLNGIPGARRPIAGWDVGATAPWFHRLRFVMDVSGFSGTNLGAPQKAVFIMAGGQYERRFGREGIFVKALAGAGRVDQHWGPNGTYGGNASFSPYLGGGFDTALTRQLGIRVEGGFQHIYFGLLQSPSDPVPYRIPGLPDNIGRISAGLTWAPRPGAAFENRGDQRGGTAREPVDSELIYEGLGSFGHYHIFGYSWWSYLHTGGLEYDRHTWGKFIGARMDYIAEIVPVVILKQPAETDVFGDPLSSQFETAGGLGISPIGLRMMWRDGKRWKPYFLVKAGMIGFAQKALSQDGSYENFSLQQSIGIQIKLNTVWDFRMGLEDFHISNAFVVPGNPGIDEMSYSVGLSYHFAKRQARF